MVDNVEHTSHSHHSPKVSTERPGHEKSRRHDRHAWGTILAISEEPNHCGSAKMIKTDNLTQMLGNHMRFSISLRYFSLSKLDLFDKTDGKRYSFVRSPKFLQILPDEPKGTIFMSGQTTDKQAAF